MNACPAGKEDTQFHYSFLQPQKNPANQLCVGDGQCHQEGDGPGFQLLITGKQINMYMAQAS